MSTKQVTTSTNQYDPTSMGIYKGFQPTVASGLADYAKNPLLATYFNTQLQMANKSNQAMGNAANQQFMWNQHALGPVANRSAYMASNLNRIQRSNLARQSDTFNNLLLNAEQVRRGALSAMQGYHPLQTGQTQTQSMSGLGTWLPQLVGMGISAATMGMGGAGGAAMGAITKPSGGGIGGMQIAPSGGNYLMPWGNNSSNALLSGGY